MIALDTNVLIYACDKADPRRPQVALDLVSRSVDGVLLWQVACKFVAASRKLRSQGFHPSTPGTASRNTLLSFRLSSRPPARLRELAFSTQKTDGHSGTR